MKIIGWDIVLSSCCKWLKTRLSTMRDNFWKYKKIRKHNNNNNNNNNNDNNNNNLGKVGAYY